MDKEYEKKVVQEFNSKINSIGLNDLLYLIELKRTFDHIGIPSVYYSLNGYAEDAICIEYNDGNWFLYSGEKGNKYNLEEYKKIEDACYNLILRISESEDECKQIQNVFERELKKTAIINEYARTPSDTASREVQVAVLTARIQELTEHLKENQKRYYFERGLLKKAGQIRGLLNYCKTIVIKGYCYLVDKMIRLKR